MIDRGAVTGWSALACSVAMFFAVAAIVSAEGCGHDSNAVVAYVSVDEHAARPVLDLFTARTGIAVRALYDSEVNKTTGLAERLRREHASPRADLFWSSESVQAGRLARDGILEPPPEGCVPTMVRARVLVYDPARVRPEDLPRDWWELSSPRFKAGADGVGSDVCVVMADPRFGSTSGHVAAMAAWCAARGEPDRFSEWARALRRNGVKQLTSGNAGVVRTVASGEAIFGMTDTDDVAAHNAQPGARPLAEIALRHGSGNDEGPWIVTGVAAIVVGAPHEAGARELLRFLESAEAQELMQSAAPGFFAVAAARSRGLDHGLVVDQALVEAGFARAVATMVDPDRAP